MQLLGALRFCRRVDLVGENVVGVGHSDTFREWRNDSDADSALFDGLFDVGKVWKTTCGSVRGGVLV